MKCQFVLVLRRTGDSHFHTSNRPEFLNHQRKDYALYTRYLRTSPVKYDTIPQLARNVLGSRLVLVTFDFSDLSK